MGYTANWNEPEPSKKADYGNKADKNIQTDDSQKKHKDSSEKKTGPNGFRTSISVSSSCVTSTPDDRDA